MDTTFIKTLKDVESLLTQTSFLEPGWESKGECYRWIRILIPEYRSVGTRRSGSYQIAARTGFAQAIRCL